MAESDEFPIDITIQQQPRIIRRFCGRISQEFRRVVPQQQQPQQQQTPMVLEDRLSDGRLRHRLLFGTQNITVTFGGNMADSGRCLVRHEAPRTSERLIEMLDHIEKRVEILREQASAMELEKSALLSMISTIQTNKDMRFVTEDEREEIELTANRLMYRALTVEVSVSTPRNELQEQALDKVNQYVDELLERFRTDLDVAECVCRAYLNACLPENRGTIDQKFQACIIECTADDQKKTRKRLESLLTSIKHALQNRDTRVEH